MNEARPFLIRYVTHLNLTADAAAISMPRIFEQAKEQDS